MEIVQQGFNIHDLRALKAERQTGFRNENNNLQ